MNLNHAVVDFVKVSDVVIPDTFFNRLTTGVSELDDIFGGGLIPGYVVTIRSKPGVGKSTITLTLSELLHNRGYNVGYASGEENAPQIAFACKRLGITNLKISTETDVDVLASRMDEFDVLVIDSFQCLTVSQKLSKPRKNEYIITNLVNKAKDNNCTLIFIVQLNSDGTIKGGTDLPYAVDTNIEILSDKDDKSKRIIRVEKSRMGGVGDHITHLTSTGYAFHNKQNTIVTKKKLDKDWADIFLEYAWTAISGYAIKKFNEKFGTKRKEK